MSVDKTDMSVETSSGFIFFVYVFVIRVFLFDKLLLEVSKKLSVFGRVQELGNIPAEG